MVPASTEDHQRLGEVPEKGLKQFGYSREDLTGGLFAIDKEQFLDLYCSKGQNGSHNVYWPSVRMAHGNPRFSELQKVLTKVALEPSRRLLCSPDWGAHGRNEYWLTAFERLTLTSSLLPDNAMYVRRGMGMSI